MTETKYIPASSSEIEPTIVATEISEIPFPTQAKREEEKDAGDPRKVAAGIAVGVFTLTFGPVIAILAGLGAAFATEKPGAAGDACRAVGDLALNAKEKATEIDQKHNISGNIKDSYEKNGALKTVGNGLSNTVENVRKSHFLERSLRVIGGWFQFLADKVKGDVNEDHVDPHLNEKADPSLSGSTVKENGDIKPFSIDGIREE